MISLNQNKKAYLAGAILIVAALAILVFLIGPLFNKIKTDSLALAQDKQIIETSLQDWQSLTQSKNDYQQVKNNLNSLPAIMPRQNAVNFIAGIENMALATGNQENISVLPAYNSDSDLVKNSLPLQISLIGAWPNLIKFMILLENASYFNDISSVKIARISNEPGKSDQGAIGEINSSITSGKSSSRAPACRKSCCESMVQTILDIGSDFNRASARPHKRKV